jgi:tRNA(Ile)-lysidine synthase
MQSNLENIVADFVKSNQLFGSGDRIILAVSGGADSLALMYVLHSLRSAGRLKVELSVAHVNHQLRGTAADEDERFVVRQAKKLNLPVTVRRIDVRRFARENKLSIETAARKLRIKALLEIAETAGSSLVATAHQKNDNAETIVHRLLRGTGFRGLAGIRPKTNFTDSLAFVRPMLCATREQIVQYLREWKFDWRRDHTNQDLSYTRNYIRHILLPELQKDCAGRLIEHLSELARSGRGFYALLCRQVEKIWPKVIIGRDKDVIVLNRKIFSTQTEPVKVELARRCLTEIGSGERGLTAKHYNLIDRLACKNITGKEILLPNGYCVRTEYENLIFEKFSTVQLQPQPQSIPLEIPGQTRFADYLIEAKIIDAQGLELETFKKNKDNLIECFDLDRICPPLVVRRRRAGDRFWPMGMPDKKRVGKFITAARLTRESRDKLLVIADREKIIWLAPVRAGEETRLTDRTKRILRLQLIPSP